MDNIVAMTAGYDVHSQHIWIIWHNTSNCG